jgi:cell pole-organizing protein PopZ
MSAPNTPSDPAAGDPSMEDILASIRRILSEEESQGNAVPAPVDDVLQLDQTMMLPAEQAAPAVLVPPGSLASPSTEAVKPAEIHAPSEMDEPATPEPPAYPSPAGTPGGTPLAEHHDEMPEPYGDLVAPAAAAAAAQSVGSLMKTLAAERALQISAGGPTIEDIVRQEIRALLKQWLDSNLPPMVERLVRTEIERVVGRAVP